MPTHPRLIFPASDEASLERKLAADPFLANIHDRIVKVAEAQLELPHPKRIVEGRRLLRVSRTYLKRILFQAYAYRMTDDKRFLEYAEGAMLAAADFEDWNPSHFLDTAEMTAALAFGYDWLHDELSDASRERIRKAITELGLRPSLQGQEKWMQAKTNWNQVCHTGMALGAWAIYETDPELCQAIIDRANKYIIIPQQAYDPDGAYPEGAMYWAYGTSFNAIFIDAFESVYGDKRQANITDSFLKSGDYFLHAQGPNGFFNYADGRERVFMAAAAYWTAQASDSPEQLYYQKPLMKSLVESDTLISPDDHSLRLFVPAFLWLSRLDSTDIKKPAALSWTGDGLNPVSLHRSSWSDDALYLGIKGGSPYVNHGHMDVGSFVIDALGERWAIDLGAHDYHTLESANIDIWERDQASERWTIMRYNNRLHNTLVVDDELQKVHGHSPIVDSVAIDALRGAKIDLQPVYQGQLDHAIRKAAIVDGRYFAFEDEIVPTEDGSEVRWAILTKAEIRIENSSTVILKQGGKRLTFQIATPSDAKIETFSAQPENDFEDKNPGATLIGFKTNLPGETRSKLTVILAPGGEPIQTDDPSFQRFLDW